MCASKSPVRTSCPSTKPTFSSWPSTRDFTETVLKAATEPSPSRQIGASRGATGATTTGTGGPAAPLASGAFAGSAVGPPLRFRPVIQTTRSTPPTTIGASTHRLRVMALFYVIAQSCACKLVRASTFLTKDARDSLGYGWMQHGLKGAS